MEIGWSGQIGSSTVTKDPYWSYLFALPILPHGIYAQSSHGQKIITETPEITSMCKAEERRKEEELLVRLPR